jgi:hypothetical protein
MSSEAYSRCLRVRGCNAGCYAKMTITEVRKLQLGLRHGIRLYRLRVSAVRRLAFRANALQKLVCRLVTRVLWHEFTFEHLGKDGFV